jgi:hypothetical protein
VLADAEALRRAHEREQARQRAVCGEDGAGRAACGEEAVRTGVAAPVGLLGYSNSILAPAGSASSASSVSADMRTTTACLGLDCAAEKPWRESGVSVGSGMAAVVVVVEA